MPRLLPFFNKGVRILIRRVRAQGVRTTFLWMYARAVPKLTGVPIMRYSQVTPDLYVGPQFKRRGLQKLSKLGVTYCVNMRIEYDDAANGLAVEGYYCHLPTVDDQAPSIEHLEQGVSFIKQAIASGGKVYIHCAGGIGRAPTMAAAYLMSEGYSLEEALALIRKRRAFINIMPPQMEALRRFDETLRARTSTALPSAD